MSYRNTQNIINNKQAQEDLMARMNLWKKIFVQDYSEITTDIWQELQDNWDNDRELCNKITDSKDLNDLKQTAAEFATAVNKFFKQNDSQKIEFPLWAVSDTTIKISEAIEKQEQEILDEIVKNSNIVLPQKKEDKKISVVEKKKSIEDEIYKSRNLKTLKSFSILPDKIVSGAIMKRLSTELDVTIQSVLITNRIISETDNDILTQLFEKNKQLNDTSKDPFYTISQKSIDLITSVDQPTETEKSVIDTTMQSMHKILAQTRIDENAEADNPKKIRLNAKNDMKKTITDQIINNPKIPETSGLKMAGRAALNVLLFVPIFGQIAGYRNWRETGDYFFSLKTKEEISGTKLKETAKEQIIAINDAPEDESPKLDN